MSRNLITVADDIAQLFKTNPMTVFTPIQVAIRLQHNRNSVRGRISEMTRYGELQRVDGGYQFPQPTVEELNANA